MRIAMAQINSTLGSFKENGDKIVEFARRALERRCDLVVFPEHALFGYLPNDLLERTSVVEEQLAVLKKIEKSIPAGIGVLFGCVTFAGQKSGATAAKAGIKRGESSLAIKRLHNAAALMEKGKPTKYFFKERLPNYDVFDEVRHLVPGELKKGRVRFRGKNLQITICEDIWGWDNPKTNPINKLPRTGIDLVVNLSASPFTKRKREQRLHVLKQTAQHFRAPVVYVNIVGGQDEVLFDGRSMVIDPKGKPLSQLVAFEEDIGVFDLKTGETGHRVDVPAIELLRRALVTGIRDFARKTKLERVHLGLSGGIDSAVVACLAVDALGPRAVTGVTMPGPFNDPNSRTWAEGLAKNLGIRCLNFEIEPAYQTLVKTFDQSLGETKFGVVHENLQARIRGVLLMALSNHESSMLLSTGNKSEYASGYTTIYGDQCGGLAPLGDLLKNEVFALAEYYNQQSELIPREIIDRPPSAELRPNQNDQDTLPSYDVLDAAVDRLVTDRAPAKSDVEKWLLGAMYRSEFKRWQAPPILKVSDHAFGRGRRMPIANTSRA